MIWRAVVISLGCNGRGLDDMVDDVRKELPGEEYPRTDPMTEIKVYLLSLCLLIE